MKTSSTKTAILPPRLRAHLEPEDIRPVVVPRRIEALSLLEQPGRLEIGVEDALLVVERAREVGAVRCEDRAAAPADHVVLGDRLAQGEILWVRGRALEVTRRDHECPRFARDVNERGLPALTVVRGRGDVELHA